MVSKSKKNTEPLTTRARLGAVIKSARDIMRKDAGLNGDLDRLPQLSWLLFLRLFDATEEERRHVKIINGETYEPAIKEGFRWRDWAANRDFSGDDLLKFVNGELLPHLRGLTSADKENPRNILSSVFRETHNRMLSGVLLRDLIDEVNKINFASSDDIHVLAVLYESILKEMRDAAGDSGEFYTPRPVIKFMVEQSFLKLGETMLDPACGTGGFLVEAYEELKDRPKTSVQRRKLHESIRGIEKKPLPYLLGMMNMLLHGLENPRITHANALVQMLNENKPADRVKVVLTNPPFGGEEENSVAARFAAGMQTKETAWLFLQAIIDKLEPRGRCAIVLPNGALFGGGVGARIKVKLLRECNLHTIVRLPQGVFAPYTQIPANLLFFEKAGPTKEVWYYQVPLPEGRRGYTKTKPMRHEEFADCAEWWGGEKREGRAENKLAWRVPMADIEANEYNLDLANPNGAADLAHRDPQELIADLRDMENEFLTLLGSLGLGKTDPDPTRTTIRVGDVLKLSREPVSLLADQEYTAIGIKSFGNGIFHYPPCLPDQLSKLRYFRFPASALALSNIKAWEGAIGVTTENDVGAIASNRFLFYVSRSSEIDVRYLYYYFLSDRGLARIGQASPGSADRNRTLSIASFENLRVPLPDIHEQRRIVSELDRAANVTSMMEQMYKLGWALRMSSLNAAFSGKL